MTLSPAITLFGLHLVDTDLLALTVLQNVCGDACALDNGSTENGAFIVDDCEDTVELNGLACLGAELLDKDNVTLGDTVLLTAGKDNSMLH